MFGMCMLSQFNLVWLFGKYQSSHPGYSVQEILQERLLKWIAMPFSKESSQPRDRNPHLLCLLLWKQFVYLLSHQRSPYWRWAQGGWTCAPECKLTTSCDTPAQKLSLSYDSNYTMRYKLRKDRSMFLSANFEASAPVCGLITGGMLLNIVSSVVGNGCAEHEINCGGTKAPEWMLITCGMHAQECDWISGS